MKHFLLLFSLICFSKLTFSQLTETEVKNMINASAEKDLIAENSRFMQENFFHFANLVADKLLTFNKENANTMFVQFFMQSKSAELIGIFKKGTPQEKQRTIEILGQLDIANASKYKEELK